MTVTEQPIPNWDDSYIKTRASNYPQPVDPHAFKLYFLALFIGSRGVGKSTGMVKLLKRYEAGIIDPLTDEKCDQRVVIFSPTIQSNSFFTSLKGLDPDDVHTEYSEPALKEVVKSFKETDLEYESYLKKMKVWNAFLSKPVEKLTDDEVGSLHEMNFEEPEKVRRTCNFLIMDDLVGTNALKNGRNPFVSLCLKNRHHSVSILIGAQTLKSVPRAIRNNSNLFFLYRFASRKAILEDMYDEV